MNLLVMKFLPSEDILFAAMIFDISKENMTCKHYNMWFCRNTIYKSFSKSAKSANSLADPEIHNQKFYQKYEF